MQTRSAVEAWAGGRFFWRVKLHHLSSSQSWSQHHFIAIWNPERHVRKASHRGSKQQQRSPDEITPLLLVRATYIYFCSSRTSRSWWIKQSTQPHRRSCNICNVLKIPGVQMPQMPPLVVRLNTVRRQELMLPDSSTNSKIQCSLNNCQSRLLIAANLVLKIAFSRFCHSKFAYVTGSVYFT